ncbi:MAG: hypothetical protein K6D03_07665 [Solobacterium sp.]|nr:hypothetical protein [Solobacterium sp.]
MASEYLKWKYRDVKHREKRELTKEEKRRNWWAYNKYIVAGAVIAVILGADLIRTMAGFKTEPADIQIACATEKQLPEHAAEALSEAFSAYASDYDGNGKVNVQINLYSMSDDSSTQEQMYYAYASQVTLVSDLETCGSYIFLLDDPETFQRMYEVLSHTDGTLPENGSDWKQSVYAWKDIPALSSMDFSAWGLSQKDFENLYIARRGFWTEKTTANPEQCGLFWDTVTAH